MLSYDSVYRVSINYDLPQRQQVKAGNFDLKLISHEVYYLITKDPTEHLAEVPSGQIKQSITPFHLGRYANTEVILSEMGKLNLRPTSSHETLAFAAAHPDVQLKLIPLIGLGSVWVRRFPASDATRWVLCLGGYPSTGARFFFPRLFEDGWGGNCSFLAVPK